MKIMPRMGFTLVEVLVSIGIVALLAALLFPVLANAQRAGRRTEYLSRLRQVDLAHRLYVDANGLPGVTSVGLGKSIVASQAQSLALLPNDKNPGGLAHVLGDAYRAIQPKLDDYSLDWTELLPAQTILMGNRSSGLEVFRETTINSQVRTARRAIPYLAILLPVGDNFDVKRDDPHRTIGRAFLGGATAIRMTDAGSAETITLPSDKAGPSTIFLGNVIEPPLN